MAAQLMPTKRPELLPALLVDERGDMLPARPVFPVDEDPSARRGGQLDVPPELLDGRAPPDEGVASADLPRSWRFSSSSRFWRRAFWTVSTTFSRDRGFSRKSNAPILRRLDGRFDRPVPRDHDDLGAVIPGLDLFQDVEAVHFGQPDVQHEEDSKSSGSSGSRGRLPRIRRFRRSSPRPRGSPGGRTGCSLRRR